MIFHRKLNSTDSARFCSGVSSQESVARWYRDFGLNCFALSLSAGRLKGRLKGASKELRRISNSWIFSVRRRLLIPGNTETPWTFRTNGPFQEISLRAIEWPASSMSRPNQNFWFRSLLFKFLLFFYFCIINAGNCIGAWWSLFQMDDVKVENHSLEFSLFEVSLWWSFHGHSSGRMHTEHGAWMGRRSSAQAEDRKYF